MRRNFAQVLREGKVDIKKEYSKLFDCFYYPDINGNSDADFISSCLRSIYFAGTCLDLDEFDEKYGFYFEEQPQNFDIDYLVKFCEYIYNFALCFPDDEFDYLSQRSEFYISHINKVIEEIGYMKSFEDDYTIFVPKDSAAIAVSESELIPENVSYKILSYNHHSMKGNLEKKKETILKLEFILQGHQQELNQIDHTFKSDLFYIINSLNLRHNNKDTTSNNFKSAIVGMSENELEHWYDEIYRMCLLAFMRLEHHDRQSKLDKLKEKLNEK